MSITPEDFDALLHDVWSIPAQPTNELWMNPRAYWTLRFWVGLTRWRRFVYRLFPDKGERDLWAYLQANGAARRDWRES